ncbi:Cytochrome P450 52A2 [Pseudocercospora fuligena]|uniref:Cytochrome P450 52A2 n=1 Tax=Pseudocercospora fuligena TaxID=685502 RepID=A0A8H6RF91_9PEZI|nr:Cytochrome P450 52A2 [Pseudocercospora fuligena]
MLTAKKRGKDLLDDLFAPPLYKYHTLERTTLGEQVIETTERENTKMILATKSRFRAVIHITHAKACEQILGYNVFTSDGPFWKHSRAMFRPQFSRELINDLESVENALQLFFQALGEFDHEKWTGYVDVVPPVYRLILDTSTELLFGESGNAQQANLDMQAGKVKDTSIGLPGGDEYNAAFQLCSYWLLLRVRMGNLAGLFEKSEHYRALNIVRQVPDSYIAKAIKGEKRQSKQAKFGLLSSLVEHTRDQTELRDQCMRNSLCWQRHHLGFDTMDVVLPDSEPISIAESAGCRFLQHVINESLRLFQPVALNSRDAVKDTILPVGGGDGTKPIAVRKGQTVRWNIYAMHRRKDIWGEDALEFRPERWEDPRKTRFLGSGWAFNPFPGGPRLCLGQQYALTEAAYCIVRLLQKYDQIELDPNSAAAKDGLRTQKSLGAAQAPTELRLRFHEANGPCA